MKPYSYPFVADQPGKIDTFYADGILVVGIREALKVLLVHIFQNNFYILYNS